MAMKPSEEVFDTRVPDWDTRQREAPDLDNTLLVLGRYSSIIHIETHTGRNIGVHAPLAPHWGLARVSDPSRLDSFGMGSYSSAKFRSQECFPVVVYGSPKPEENLDLPRWISSPGSSSSPYQYDSSYGRSIIPLRGSREDEDVFVEVRDSNRPIHLWTTKLTSKLPSSGPGGGCVLGISDDQTKLEADCAGSRHSASFVPFATPVAEFKLGKSIAGGAEIHGRLARLIIGCHDAVVAVDVTRAFEGAKTEAFVLWTSEHGSAVEFVDTACRFEGLLDAYPSAGHMSNIACSSGTLKCGKFWDVTSGELVGETPTPEWPLVNRCVPARNLWLLGTKLGFDVVDMRKMSEVAATIRKVHTNESDFMRDVDDIGSNGRTFVSGSQNSTLSLWTLDEALKAKLHWVRRMPGSVWSARATNKARDGFLFGESPGVDSEEFERVMFWLGMVEGGPSATCLSIGSVKSIRAPKCFVS